MSLKLKPIALAAALIAGPAAASDDMKAVLAEMKRLADRVESLEKQNKELEKSLASERLSEKEPEIATRLKAVEFQTLSMQKQARQIEALEGISVGASLTGVGQRASRDGVAGFASRQSRANYRGDVSVTLPGGEMGDIEGKIFTHFRFGQGNGVGLRPTYTSTPNTTAFETNAGPDDSFAILAQAWYQLKVPLPRDGIKANSREHHPPHRRQDRLLRLLRPERRGRRRVVPKFLNNAFVHNPLLDSGGDIRADAYGFAPGAILQYVNEHDKSRTWGLSLGAFGSGPGANFSGSMGKPYIIGQADTTWRWNHLPGNYRAYLWTNGRGMGYDGLERRHSGIGMSIDQKVTTTSRCSAATATRVPARCASTARSPSARKSPATPGDAAPTRSARRRPPAHQPRPIAATRSRSTSTATARLDPRASGTERIGEIYYRFRVNSLFELTPDFQFIQRPGGDGGAPTVKVVGLRAKLGF
jgi:high affinity Mn2+ porin